MTDVIEIRHVTPADFEAWLPLWEGYNSFYGRSGDTALPHEVTQLTWRRFLDQDEPMYAMVAERAGELLGLAHYLFHRSTILADNTCYLQDLFTLESERGKGVGRKLINGVYAQAKAGGSKRVYWLTHEANQTAMQLYNSISERSGFVVYRKIF